MNCIDIKVEKSNAMLRYKRIENITALFRLMEICIFLFIISRLSTHLPLAFKVFGDCIRCLYITIFSPGFLFLLGNSIVLVLFLKSGHHSAQETNVFNYTIKFCNEYVESFGNKLYINQVEDLKKQGEDGRCEEKEAVLDLCSFEDRKMLRCHSETLMRYQHRDCCIELRPTVTENGRKTGKHNERVSDAAMIQKSCDHKVSAQNFNPKCYAEDEMSGEEFRHEVEAFIARQKRSLREEFSSIVTFGN